ncbi:hypothetical protein SDC9_78779 [bioreactor metagenome]|uniref:Uncharacterized protein n=1 Tax=bioreactor metagenome TaxID=1076179 RepID=A0A644YW34_9ZZZZ
MHHPGGLHRPLVDGHAALQGIVGRAGDHDAEVLHRGAPAAFVDAVDIDHVVVPDRHGAQPASRTR